MAGIFDDLREKGNGILSDLNDYLFTGKGSTLPQDSFTDPDTSNVADGVIVPIPTLALGIDPEYGFVLTVQYAIV